MLSFCILSALPIFLFILKNYFRHSLQGWLDGYECFSLFMTQRVFNSLSTMSDSFSGNSHLGDYVLEL